MAIRLNGISHWVMWEMAALFEHIGTVQDGITTLSRPRSVVDSPQAQPLRVTRGEIRFEDVCFAYGTGNAVIDHLDLAIRPGEKIGLVGRSGAGKSTIVNLLLRFYDTEHGRITIDGQDIALATQDSLRAQIGMVTQDTSLLHRSVRENIVYGRPDATDDEMIAAARRAEADEFVGHLVDPKGRRGYDAHVGERGVKLSGGQRQRIAIARVMLKDAPILLLDEATSALDSEVEAAIQQSLYRLMEGKTVVAIAHRLSTIAAMDRLIVLDHGRVVEEGDHRSLLARGGLYARLWAHQSGGFLGDDTGDEAPVDVPEPAWAATSEADPHRLAARVAHDRPAGTDPSGRLCNLTRRQRPARQRAATSRAAQRSSSAVPTDLNSVISSSRTRPGCRPAHRSASSARTCSTAIVPAPSGCTRSPASLSAPAYVSTKTLARRMAASSHSRIAGVKAPTRSTCTPGRSAAPCTIDAVEVVAQVTMSATARAASRSPATCAGSPAAASRAAVAAARSAERPQTSTRSIARTAQCACAMVGASAPVPITSRRFASSRARQVDASADAAPVRRSVRASPSIRARGCPVAPSISTYSAATLASPRARLRGNTVTILTPSPPPSQAGISSSRSPAGVTSWLERTGTLAPATKASRSAATSDG